MRRITFSILLFLFSFTSIINAQKGDSNILAVNDTQSISYNARIDREFRDSFEKLVLLKNHGGLLPLQTESINSIALIGPTIYNPGIGNMAVNRNSLQNYISPFHAFDEMLGDRIDLYKAIGINMKDDVTRLDSSMVYIGQGINGFSAKYYHGKQATGTPVIFATDKYIDFYWGEALPYPEFEEEFSVSWDATLIPGHGPVKVKLIHTDGCRLFLDGKLIIDAWMEGPLRIDSAWLNIKKGQSYNLQIDFFSVGGPAVIKLGFDYLMSNMIYEAVEKAKRADVAIVFVGQTTCFEDKGTNGSYYLIPNQSRLIQAVYEANPNTVVVMQTASALDIEDWAFNIPAIIQAWSPGERSSQTIANVIFGDKDPAGKLPFRWVMNWNQNFSTRYPYGHGLSYATIGIGKLMMRKNHDGSGWTATIETKNVGSRMGAEVLQLYIADQVRMKKTDGLKAFKKVSLRPGQKNTVGIQIPYEAFETYNSKDEKWTLDPGRYEIMVGISAEEIKLRKTIEIKEIHLNK